MKRICLFAGYNAKNYVEKYVYDYLRELSKYSEIYYMADGEPVQKEDIKTLLKYCKNVYFIRHQKYDFGSYSLLAKKFVGWDKIVKHLQQKIIQHLYGQMFQKLVDRTKK